MQEKNILTILISTYEFNKVLVEYKQAKSQRKEKSMIVAERESPSSVIFFG